ncbi:Panacea domain-containing protein [Candidatus Avelusimicrobium alvi]|uniref:Panacea domain-containing protein n=1 Tax=Candidatus Avelusimicrobium alvi TaxID=3416221 RepID=UPI003D0B3602
MNNYYEKKLAAVIRILGKLKKVSSVKLMKLLYIADKVHLNNYGRTISMDSFCAMQKGPVPSLSYDMIKKLYPVELQHSPECNLTPESIASLLNKYAEVKVEDDKKVVCLKKEEASLYSFLSESDIKTLDKVSTLFETTSDDSLVDLTHHFEEWKKFKEDLSNKKTSFRFPVQDMVNRPESLAGLIDLDNFEFIKESLADASCSL